LSTQRAEVVSEYLIDKGVWDENVSFEGFGSSQPIGGNETIQGRSKNRRVEILIRNPLK
jgi:outer membrane protein OmpA-like peptidoglycan-associated protein